MERVYFAGDRFLRIWVKDTLNTIINLPWWQVITLFALSLIGSWLGFSLIWWLIWRYYDGDCLAEVSGYNSALLFSIETQTTIGYGSKHVTADCRLGTFILIIQSVVGPIIDAIWLGLVFQKICRPHAVGGWALHGCAISPGARPSVLTITLSSPNPLPSGNLRCASHTLPACVGATASGTWHSALGTCAAKSRWPRARCG